MKRNSATKSNFLIEDKKNNCKGPQILYNHVKSICKNNDLQFLQI